MTAGKAARGALHRLAHLLRDRNALLVTALALGVILGPTAGRLSWLNLPGLALAMTVSLTGIGTADLRPVHRVLRAVGLGLLLTYLVNGGALLVLGRLLTTDPQLWIGLVLLAATPSGIAVIPFSYVLGGDVSLALISTLGVYVSAIVVMPLLAVLLLGTAVIEPLRLITVLVQLVVVPLLLSRVINVSPLKEPVGRWRGTLVNWSFALVICTVIGLNRDAVLRQPLVMLTLALVGLVSTFGLGWVLEKVLRWRRVSRPQMVTTILLGTIKNTSMTAATVLMLLGERASLGPAVVNVMTVIYLVYLGVHWAQTEAA